MATSIGNLVAVVSLNSQKFERGIRRVQKRAKAFGTSVAKMGVRTAALGATAGLAAAGGIALLAKQQASVIDQTAKMADRLGIATEKLVGLRHAAKLSGVESKTLEMGLQRMTRRVAEAAKGTGEAQGAIKQLGLDAERLARLSPDQQFARIADRMKLVRTQGERVRLSFKLFDSEGVALVNTLRQGADGLERAQREAERLGLTFSRIDASKIEAANDSFAKVVALVKATGRAIAVTVAPMFDKLSKSIVAYVGDLSGLRDTVKDLGRGFARFVGSVVGGFKSLQAAAIQTQVSIETLFQGIKRARGGVVSDAELVRVGSLRVSAARLTEEAKGMGEAFANAYDQMHAKFERANDSAKGFAGFIGKLRLAGERFRMQVMADALQDPLEGLDKSGALTKFAERLKTLGDEFRERIEGGMARAREIRDRFNSRGENAAVERGTVEAFRATRKQDRHAADTAMHTKDTAGLLRELLAVERGQERLAVATF